MNVLRPPLLTAEDKKAIHFRPSKADRQGDTWSSAAPRPRPSWRMETRGCAIPPCHGHSQGSHCRPSGEGTGVIVGDPASPRRDSSDLEERTRPKQPWGAQLAVYPYTLSPPSSFMEYPHFEKLEIKKYFYLLVALFFNVEISMAPPSPN